ncbi:GNAT family N-acetyltransferase [Geovibrio ferrireducens]|uniref:GNAT family N-acetyltransferase n=1 Tax=Geovibrio ferrireducens TaxID=46201 RepID=UPI00224671C2|nr:GNAT family N-acetyltransferase [Geovibrio ferrireducens]
MTDTITLRPAEKSDISGMIEVLSELLALENETVDEAAMRKGFEMLMNDPERYCIFIAEQDGEIVGMCQAQSLISVDEGAKVAYVENMVVRGSLRSSGVGAKLLAAVEDCCRESGHIRIHLLVLEKNHKGIQFYSRNGWKKDTHVYMDKEL